MRLSLLCPLARRDLGTVAFPLLISLLSLVGLAASSFQFPFSTQRRWYQAHHSLASSFLSKSGVLS